MRTEEYSLQREHTIFYSGARKSLSLSLRVVLLTCPLFLCPLAPRLPQSRDQALILPPLLFPLSFLWLCNTYPTSTSQPEPACYYTQINRAVPKGCCERTDYS
jgi:hypothetical protein